MLDEVSSQILYVLSGFLFGVFSCRYGTIFRLVAVFLFPIWMSTRTELGAFVYLATFIYYTARNRRKK